MQKSLGEYPLGKLRKECEDDIKIDLNYASIKHERLMQLSRDLVPWQSLLLLAPNLVPVQNLYVPLWILIPVYSWKV